MKKLVLTCLIFLSAAAPVLASVRHKQASKNAVAKAFAEKTSEEDSQGLNFGVTVKHDGAAQYTSSGSIKTIQIFPLNTASGVLTYDFS